VIGNLVFKNYKFPNKNLTKISVMKHKAVIFDLGGVIIDGLPIQSIQNYSEKVGLPKNAINKIILIENNPFNLLETSSINPHEFSKKMKDILNEKFPENKFDGIEFLKMLNDSFKGVRKNMITAIKILKNNGFRVGVITNNYYYLEEPPISQDFLNLFEFVIESRVVKIRKPNPKIYELALEKLKDVKPEEVVFLDDLGINLKSASKLGIKTIKVVNENQSLKELGDLLDLTLIKSNL
jgi:putative hydrolase of the HAD superfamily